MKPKIIAATPKSVKQDTLQDTLLIEPLMPLIEQQPKTKSVKIEIPIIGTVESDSGNHMVDIGTVLGIIAVLYLGKRIIGRYIK